MYNFLVVLYIIRNNSSLSAWQTLSYTFKSVVITVKMCIGYHYFVWLVNLYFILGNCLWSWSSDGSWTSEESPRNVSVLSLPVHSLISVSPVHSLFMSVHAPFTHLYYAIMHLLIQSLKKGVATNCLCSCLSESHKLCINKCDNLQLR